jgi:predicted phosphohydrolase
VLVHAGDWTNFGNHRDDFLDWFTDQPFEHRLLILGNHEKMGITRDAIHRLERRLADRSDLHSIDYQSVTINGIRFGPAGGDHDVDVVVTHQPPVSILDNGKGKKGLRQTIARQSPDVHVFGHIHDAYGRITVKDTIFVNCALAGKDYEPVNDPMVVHLN